MAAGTVEHLLHRRSLPLREELEERPPQQLIRDITGERLKGGVGKKDPPLDLVVGDIGHRNRQRRLGKRSVEALMVLVMELLQPPLEEGECALLHRLRGLLPLSMAVETGLLDPQRAGIEEGGAVRPRLAILPGKDPPLLVLTEPVDRLQLITIRLVAGVARAIGDRIDRHTMVATPAPGKLLTDLGDGVGGEKTDRPLVEGQLALQKLLLEDRTYRHQKVVDRITLPVEGGVGVPLCLPVALPGEYGNRSQRTDPDEDQQSFGQAHRSRNLLLNKQSLRVSSPQELPS
jgi:hypothetical protein